MTWLKKSKHTKSSKANGRKDGRKEEEGEEVNPVNLSRDSPS
jgi:hypothetical protein